MIFVIFFEKMLFYFSKLLILLHVNSFKLQIQGDIRNPHVKLHQNPSTTNFFLGFSTVTGLARSCTVQWKNNRKSWMNGSFCGDGLVPLSIVHNMHQLVFAPTQALGRKNGQNIENQHFCSQFQKIRIFNQIRSFQNGFKLYCNQLPFVKPISGYVNLMLQRHVSQIGIIFS